MTDPELTPGLHLDARRIPVPQHVSEQARLALSQPSFPAATWPAIDDNAGWKAMIAARDEMLAGMFAGQSREGFAIEDWREGDALAYDIRPDGWDNSDGRVYLDVHGGGLIMGGGEICKAMALNTAAKLQARVVAVDYRMPPDHPYPAGLDDCMALYRALLRDHAPHEIIVGGGSAGANLAAATLLRARDEGLPLPAGLVLISPEADLTESGDSFQTNAGIDPMGSLMPANLLYAAGRDLKDPYISPLFGDFTKGFAPTYMSTGTRDLFLSNTVRLHRKLRAAGVFAELHVIEAAPHAAFGGTSPEEAHNNREIKGFCDARWAGR